MPPKKALLRRALQQQARSGSASSDAAAGGRKGKKAGANRGGDDDDDELVEIETSKTVTIPEEHQLPTSDLLGTAEANLAPFRAKQRDAAAPGGSQRQAEKRLFSDTPSFAADGDNVDGGGDDDDDMDDFEAGIVSDRTAANSQAAKLIADARLRRGLEVTFIADQIDVARISTFNKAAKGKQRQDDAAAAASSGAAAAAAASTSSFAPAANFFSSPPPGHRWIGHNRNTITCVASTPPSVVVPSVLSAIMGSKRRGAAEAAAAAITAAQQAAAEGTQQETGWTTGARMLCCYGDKSGRVYAVLERTARSRMALEPAHKAAVTCIAVSDAPPAASLSNERISIAATKIDRHIIASGAADGTIHFWSGVTLQFRGAVSMHRGAVTGVAFRAGSHTLYSVSKDAVLRVWDALEQPARHVDKLYGHTAGALCVAAAQTSFLETATAARGALGRAVSGGDDRVPRLWKIDAATESEFNVPSPGGADGASAGSVECITVVGIGGGNNFAFAVGTSRGTLALYDANKRNPVWSKEEAHGRDVQGDGTGLEGQLLELESVLAKQRQAQSSGAAKKQLLTEEEQDAATCAPVRRPGLGNPISAIAAVPGGDVVATGSGDGAVRLWRVVFDEQGGGAHKLRAHNATKVPRGLELLAEIAVPGWVNGLSFALATGSAQSKKEWSLFVTTGKEQRLGRWVVFSAALNGIVQVPLNRGFTPLIQEEEEEAEDDADTDFPQKQQQQRGKGAVAAKATATARKRPAGAAARDVDISSSVADPQQRAILQKLSASGTDLPPSLVAGSKSEKKQLSDLRQKFLQTPSKRAAKKEKIERKAPAAKQQASSSSVAAASSAAAAAPTKKKSASAPAGGDSKPTSALKKKLLAAKLRGKK